MANKPIIIDVGTGNIEHMRKIQPKAYISYLLHNLKVLIILNISAYLLYPETKSFTQQLSRVSGQCKQSPTAKFIQNTICLSVFK